MRAALKAIEKKGCFKAYIESNEAYMKQCGRIKLVKAQLAELDDSNDREAGPPKKSTKKSNMTTAEASPTDPALQAEFVTDIEQAQEAADKTKAKG